MTQINWEDVNRIRHITFSWTLMNGEINLIPEDKRIYINKTLNSILADVENIEYIFDKAIQEFKNVR